MFSFFQRILHLSATFHTTILLNKCFLSAIPKSPSSFIEAILYSKFVHSNDLVSAWCSFLPRHWSLASIWSAENNVSGVSHNILEHGGVLKNFLSAPLSILMQSSPGRDFDISSELRRKFIPLKHLTFIFVFPPQVKDQRFVLIWEFNICVFMPYVKKWCKLEKTWDDLIVYFVNF